MHIYKWIGNLLIFVSLFTTLPAQSNDLIIAKVDGGNNSLALDVLNLILSKVDPQANIK